MVKISFGTVRPSSKCALTIDGLTRIRGSDFINHVDIRSTGVICRELGVLLRQGISSSAWAEFAPESALSLSLPP